MDDARCGVSASGGHKAKLDEHSLTLVSMLLVHALAFDNSTLISAAFLMLFRDLSSEFSVAALLGHDCLRRPDDDLLLSFCVQ